MSKALYLVLANPTAPEHDDEFVRLYADQHLQESVDCDGFVAGTLYRAWDRPIDPLMDGMGVARDHYQPPHRYLALYEWDTPDPADALGAMYEGLTSGRLASHPYIDRRDFSNFIYVPVTERVVR